MNKWEGGKIECKRMNRDRRKGGVRDENRERERGGRRECWRRVEGKRIREVGARTGRRERERVRNTDGGKNEGVGRKVKRAMRKGMSIITEYGFECTANLSYVSHLLSLFRSYNI